MALFGLNSYAICLKPDVKTKKSICLQEKSPMLVNGDFFHEFFT